MPDSREDAAARVTTADYERIGGRHADLGG
jgi:hypothetical protein